MSTVDTRTFKLTNLIPIGFKVPFYPINMCLVCRGPLTDVCTSCSENGKEECPIVLVESHHYHRHCHQFVSSDNAAKKGKKY
jgi:hypothetical protein